MVIARTLDIENDAERLRQTAQLLLALADDFASVTGGEVGLPGLVARMNKAVQDASDARDDIEAAVDEFLNTEDEYTDDEDEDEDWYEDDYDDFPMYLEYDDWKDDIPQPEF